MKARFFQNTLTLLLVVLQAGAVAAMPVAEICSAGRSSGACACGMDCCSADGTASLPFQVLKESPCCTPQDASTPAEATVPAAKTSLPAPPRASLETLPVSSAMPGAAVESLPVLLVVRIPCVTTASIPLLTSSLLI